jgi:hypothetical protein
MASRKSKPAAKKSGLTAKEESLYANYMANGFNGVQAARAAGYKGNDNVLAVTAHRVLRKAKVASRVRARLDGLHANADEVLNLLADHMRADLADFDGCFDGEGRLDLNSAREKGVSRLVKKLKSVTRTIPQGKAKPPIRETTVEIELYSAQEAAAKLIPVLGLKQKAAENEKDAEKKREYASKKLREVMERLALSEAEAMRWMTEHTPEAARYLM